MRALLAAALLVPAVAAPGPAQAPAPSPAAESAAATPAKAPGLAVFCGTLYSGTGAPQHRVWLVVRDGRVESVLDANATPPSELPRLDASDKVVMPGIVAADSQLSAQPDADYNVTPDIVALDGFDFVRPRRNVLAGGVTTVYLSPGRHRLVSGQGSVVKLHGEDLGRRIVAESCCLRVTLGKEATQAPALFEPDPAPTADEPLGPARRQWPSARISQLWQLRRLFDEAAAAAPGALLGEGADENKFDPEAMQRVLRRELPLRIAVREAADIRRALQFAGSLGARLVLEDPLELPQVADAVRGAGAIAVVHVPVRPSQSNPGGENGARDDAPRPDPALAARASRAGVPVALAAADDDDLQDFLLLAGIAVRYGMNATDALGAITSTAARALGVEARVGSLQPGRDADFVVLSGEPFATGTLVERTYVDGALAFEREAPQSVLAVRAGKVLTMAGEGHGGVLHGGVVVAAGRTIKAVGEGIPVPYGATVIDVPEGVLVPGFVDAYCHAGLAGEGTPVPAGTADQLVAGAVRHDDPVLRALAAAGVTTALVSGRDAGAVSGRVAALKTAAADDTAMVLKATAAIRFVHDAVGPDAAKPIADALDRAKRYADQWRQYEAALAAQKAGKPVELPKVEAPAEQPDPVTGTWELQIRDLPIPVELGLQASLKLDAANGTVSGSVRFSMRGNLAQPVPIQNGTFEGRTLRFEADALGGRAELQGTITDDEISGTFRTERFAGSFAGKRTSKEQAAASGAAATATEPRVDESLEPLRAVLEGKIPAIVRSDRAPAIREVVELFTARKLRFVLQGADDALETPAILGDAKPGVLLGPELVAFDGDEVQNHAARAIEAGLTLGFGSGDAAGASYLPLHAAHAVRYGLDPGAALAALTIQAAQLLGLDDRVGSLERGKDADFVVFSGPPLEVTSRVLLVVVNGRVVVDHRDAPFADASHDGKADGKAGD